MKNFFLLIFLLVSFSKLDAQNSRTNFIKDSLDSYITRTLRYWDIPGLALVIVKDGHVIKTKGYGYAEITKKARFDLNTLFPLASVNKHITSLALVSELKRQQIALDTPISGYLDDYEFDYKSNIGKITFKDLLSHQLGYEYYQGDFLLFDSDFSIKQIIKKAWSIKPNSNKSWGYHNTGYVLAGELLEKLSNSTLDTYLKIHFFNPLKMNNTISSFNQFSSISNKLTPYFNNNGIIEEIEHSNTDNYIGAGGVYSTLNDMSKWIVELFANDPIVIKNDIINEIQKPLVKIADGGHTFNKTSDVFYGLGFRIQDYAGHHLIYHTGGLPGSTSILFMLPDENLGVFIVCNMHASGYPMALMYEILDAYLNLPYRSYTMIYEKYYSDYYKKKYYSENKPIVVDSLSTHTFSNFIGSYSNNIYGRLKLYFKDNKLMISFEHHPKLEGYLTSFKDKVLEFKLNSLFFNKAEIQTNDLNENFVLTFLKSDPNKYEFKKVN